MLSWMEGRYGNIIISLIMNHYHLGMDLYYSIPGKVRITIVPYLYNVIKDLLEEIRGRTAIPDADHLFKVKYN